MPLEKLSTGIYLYYESHGRGEAIVFIPGTGFSGNVWMETQVEPLSRSLHVIVHARAAAGVPLITRVSAPSIRWPMTSLRCSST
jgi:pimeloyl-ACP methyl ester carboxylesterase